MSVARPSGEVHRTTDWDRYFLNIARETASRSNCVRRQHGAVIVKHRRIRSTGYNGPPSGHPHCDEGACPRARAEAVSGWGHDNCFHGDTEFLTRQGIRRLAESEGEVVEVLTGLGWKLAKIEHFGKQPLLAVRLKRYSQEKTVLATADHRWFVVGSQRKRRVVLTRNLRTNQYLASNYSNPGGKIKPSVEGQRAGLVFGDGSCNYHQPGSGSLIVMYGPSAAELRSLWAGHPYISGDRIDQLPRRWKTELPPLDESFAYLYGWLQGYFAADGCINHSTPVLDSAVREHLEHVVEVCYILGIPTLGISSIMRTGFGIRPTPLYRLSFPQGALPAEFFLLSGHRERIGRRKRKRDMPRWHVVSVEPVPGTHDVFCAVVPDLYEFTLTGNIKVGNCIAIHSEANAILYSAPEERAGASIYITGPPCFGCAKLIANSGIDEVVTEGETYEGWEDVRNFLLDCNVRVRLL